MKTLNKKTLSKLSVTEMKCVIGGDAPTFSTQHSTSGPGTYTPCGDERNDIYDDDGNYLGHIDTPIVCKDKTTVVNH